ncbi:uncharacterized protein LOC143490391 isoform X4 [Brachyhypopomus gauderio]|uniref:uncharacterized protein LOC143490391 isoform X4 n=1 Tax=Brachyhypopomus gauderio TaxID=698409 RepID=UPI0040423130
MSKDSKMHGLKQDLDHLNEKLAHATLAIKQGSEKLKEKELDALASRSKLEEILSTVQAKEHENFELRQALHDMKTEFKKLEQSQESLSVLAFEEEEERFSLQTTIEHLQEDSQSAASFLRQELDEISRELEQKKAECLENEQRSKDDYEKTVLLSESVNNLQEQLKTETEKLRESSANHDALLSEIRMRDEQIRCMSIQISQQKELLTGLSQQLKEKDAAITQTIASASTERMRHEEQNANLFSQLEEARASLSLCQSEKENMEKENKSLVQDHDYFKSEISKLTRDKDAIRKKLHAALIVRKELLKKIEEHEYQCAQNVKNGVEISAMQEKLDELMTQRNTATKEHDATVSNLSQQLEQKDGRITELLLLVSEKEKNIVQMEEDVHGLQDRQNEQETNLSSILQKLDEQRNLIDHLQRIIKEKDAAFEQEKQEMIVKLEQLKSDLIMTDENVRSETSNRISELENEFAKLKQEKTMLHKKAHAALLARKETIKKSQETEKKYTEEICEIKKNFNALQEQYNQQTQELHSAQLSYDFKVQELESALQNSISLKEEIEEKERTIQDLRMCLTEQETKATSLLVEELKLLKDNYEKTTSEIMRKDELLVEVEARAKEFAEQIVGIRSELDSAVNEINEKNEEINLVKAELASAIAEVTQKSDELLALQNVLTVTQQQASQEHSQRQESKFEIDQLKMQVEVLQKEKERCLLEFEKSNHEVTLLESKVKQFESQNESFILKSSLTDKTVTSDHEPSKQYCESELSQLTCKQKEGDNSLFEFQTLLTEKEELITALEQQLQRQIHLHEVEMEKMRIEVSELQQKPSEVRENKSVDQLTKKLQAALISRKELMKENWAIKEQLQKIMSQNEHTQTEMMPLKSIISELKRQRTDLESSISTLTVEKQNLAADVDRILSDNHNLSAACESLKLTIENITQQKQAFSCQLESLKDSQTEELSEWKSKHADLKQEYESLLQAYENVSTEMDKMRQLLDGAKSERQQAVLKAHKYESERDNLIKQVAELEKENDKIKDKMRKFAKLKQQKIEELEEENTKIRMDLISFDDQQKHTVDELTLRNNHLESEIRSLQESSEELRGKMCELQQDNQNLAKELKETSFSLEKWHMESKATESNLQVKLNEALNLNNTFTSQIEAQKADLATQIELVELIQQEKFNLAEKLKQAESDYKVKLSERNKTIMELQRMIEENGKETLNLNERVKILEDDKCLLQEELENVQETSDKVKNENEYLETILLKNSEKIDELTEAVNVLQTQNMQISTKLLDVKEEKAKLCQETEEQHLKLVKEFEDRLKTLQRGTEGSKNMKKELQELLKEKHQEINHLQHDCIKYQELILTLERSLKHSQTQQERMEEEFKEMSKTVNNLQKENMNLENELKSHKNALNETTKELTRITSEKDGLEQELTKRQQQYELESVEKEKTVEKLSEQQQTILKEQRTELQKQINTLQETNEREAEVIVSLQKQLESRDLQVKTLQREAETYSAKLAVFSVDPNNRDAAKHWDGVFQKALHNKDSQLLEQGFVISRLLEDIRGKVRALNELQIANKKLERTVSEYSVAAAAHQRQLFIMGASNTELEQKVEILSKQLLEQSAMIEKFESDKSTLVKQLNEQTCSVSQLQSSLEHLEKVLADTESQLLTANSQSSKLSVDLERQGGILLHLKSLLQNKDREISSLLSSKDGQMSGYLEQLQVNHRSQVAGYEDRLSALYAKLESTERELRTVESKVRSLQARIDRSAQEKEQIATNMNTLHNSLVSLQVEKERLVSEIKRSRANGREELSEASLGVTKGIKQEIKTLLHQMDDLNSENAMLKAQLIRYREDLNQVLSLKDNQLKDLLKKQQDSIKNLENQKRNVEMQHRDTLLEVEKEGEEIKTLKDHNLKLQSQVQELEDSILALHKERLETNESKVITDLQKAVAAKAAECNELQQKLFAQKVATDDLSKSMKEMMKQSESKLAEAEEKYNKELDAVNREVDLMRNERETAEQRVADLARDLMQTEQQLSEATSDNKNLKSQNESLGKAMAALQNDRDQLIDNFKILRSRYDEELRETTASMNKFERQLNDATSEMSALTTERNVLVQKLLALESADPHSRLLGLVNDLSRAISEKEAELKHVSLENGSLNRQVTAFSKAMASLQTDRDRLMEELRQAKREFEYRQQQSSVDTLASIKAEESNSLSVSVDALQTERDGLFKEVVNLRSQNTELVELKHKCDDQQRALQQAQVYQLQCEREMVGFQSELAELRSEKSQLQSECHAFKQATKESVALLGKDVSSEQLLQMQAERVQLQTHIQRCLVEIQQRDLSLQQLNTRLQQTVEEKAAVSAQLRAVSQTLRDTQLSLNDLQNRCYWLENQHHTSHAPTQQDSVHVEVAPGHQEVAPGAPQEKSSAGSDLDGLEIRELRNRLAEAELQLDAAQQNVSLLNDRLEDERARREVAEEALGLAKERTKSMEPSPSRSSQRDFSIQLETDEEWEALILDPNQHLVMRKMKTGVHSCRRWLRGRSMYCSKLLTSRAKTRYLFLTYLLSLHILVFMCLSGTL